MKIKMELKADTIFGNGNSIPGGEDLSVQCDAYGFPYYKASTFKGIFREELLHCLRWRGMTEEESQRKAEELLGFGGDDNTQNAGKMVFSDFTLSKAVKNTVLNEIGENNPQEVLNAFTSTRVFTSIDAEGMAKEGTLRMGRCVTRGLFFYSTLECRKQDRELVDEVLHLIKWVGTMRNRGFGKVKLSVTDEGENHG